jgi:hypothetical protein
MHVMDLNLICMYNRHRRHPELPLDNRNYNMHSMLTIFMYLRPILSVILLMLLFLSLSQQLVSIMDSGIRLELFSGLNLFHFGGSEPALDVSESGSSGILQLVISTHYYQKS